MKTLKPILFVAFAVLFMHLWSCDKKSDDSEAPIINLKGDTLMYVNLDSAFIEPGYTAVDNEDGDITDQVKIMGSVDVSTEGNYLLRYNVTDAAGNRAEEKQRKVRVLQFK